MTQNVRKTIRSRCGNALPASVVKGTASAAARDTAPRMPAHETTNARAGGGGGLLASNAPRNLLGRYVNTGTKTRRATTTVRVTSTPHHTSSVAENPVRESRISGS